jgi:hypothetical protein
VLLATFVPTIGILAIETLGCEFLQGVNLNAPWHLAFDLLFWQVVGTTLDVTLLTPPGIFLKPWSSESARRGSALMPGKLDAAILAEKLAAAQ